MRVTEKLVKSPEEEGVTLAYIRLTKDFEEIKEYVQHKGNTLTGYKQTKEKVSVRIEDILYFETVDGRVFAYTVECVYEIKGRLYQVEEKINKRSTKEIYAEHPKRCLSTWNILFQSEPH